MENLSIADINERLKILEKIKMQNRVRANRFYNNNKNKILKKRKEKIKNNNNETIPCQCGGKYKQRFIKVHSKTKRHLKFFNNI